MRYMALFLTLILFSSPFATLLAQEVALPAGVEVSKADAQKALSEMVMSSSLSKKELIAIIDQMVATKQITAKEGEETKKAFSQMSDDDMTQMKKVMLEMMSKQLNSMKFKSTPLPSSADQ